MTRWSREVYKKWGLYTYVYIHSNGRITENLKNVRSGAARNEKSRGSRRNDKQFRIQYFMIHGHDSKQYFKNRHQKLTVITAVV